jgi:hypothetical protein
MVDGRRVGVGGESWLVAQGFAGDGHSSPEGLGAADLVAALHAEGVKNVAMVTGDRRDVALAVASQAGLDRVYPEQSPEDEQSSRIGLRGSPDSRSGPRTRAVRREGNGRQTAESVGFLGWRGQRLGLTPVSGPAAA